MIYKNDHDMSKVLSFKLTNGQELVAKATPHHVTLNSTKPSSYTLEKPQILQLSQRGGQIGMVFMPWFLSDEDATVEVDSTHFVAVITPTSAIESEYLHQTTIIDLSGASSV